MSPILTQYTASGSDKKDSQQRIKTDVALVQRTCRDETSTHCSIGPLTPFHVDRFLMRHSMLRTSTIASKSHNNRALFTRVGQYRSHKVDQFRRTAY